MNTPLIFRWSNIFIPITVLVVGGVFCLIYYNSQKNQRDIAQQQLNIQTHRESDLRSCFEQASAVYENTFQLNSMPSTQAGVRTWNSLRDRVDAESALEAAKTECTQGFGSAPQLKVEN